MSSDATPPAPPMSAPVRALSAELDAGRDLGEVVAHWLCQLAAARGGIDEVTRNRPGSWEAAHIRDLMGGTVGHAGEHLDEFARARATAARERAQTPPVTLPCPECGSAGTHPYVGRSGDLSRTPCPLCAGTGSLADLIETARGWVPDDLAARVILRRLLDAIEALDHRRPTPAGAVRLEVDVPPAVADALAGLDAEAHLDADAERAAAYALRRFVRTLKSEAPDAT